LADVSMEFIVWFKVTPVLLGKSIDKPEPGIVPGGLVLVAGIAQTNDDFEVA